MAVIHCVGSVANEASWSGHCPRRDVATSEVLAVVVVLLCP